MRDMRLKAHRAPSTPCPRSRQLLPRQPRVIPRAWQDQYGEVAPYEPHAQEGVEETNPFDVFVSGTNDTGEVEEVGLQFDAEQADAFATGPTEEEQEIEEEKTWMKELGLSVGTLYMTQAAWRQEQMKELEDEPLVAQGQSVDHRKHAETSIPTECALF